MPTLLSTAVLLLASSSFAQAQSGCFYVDASAAPPRPAPVACPGQARYDDPLPPLPFGMIWLRKRDAREYWTEVVLRPGRAGATPAFVPPVNAPYPLLVVRFDGVKPTPVNPTASDLLTRAIVEQEINRPLWAAEYAREGLVLAPSDSRLGAIAYRRGAEGPLFDAIEQRAAQDVFDDARRAIEAGSAQEALGWLDYYISIRPTPPGYLLRSNVRHALRQDDKALQDAEAGLAMMPGEPGLRAAAEQARRAIKEGLVAVPVAAAPPAPAPPQASGGSSVVLFLGFTLVLAVGLGAGYWLARKPMARGSHGSAAATELDRRATGRTALPRLRRYEVTRKIGAGGMGLVFEATDRSLKRRVAIKQMREEIKDGEKEREAFLQEADIISRLIHPHIVEFHEVVQENGEIYLVFDYVEGKSLAQLLAETKRLPLEDAKRIFTQVCEAVSCAHRGHVLHRDLKPANIMITPAGDAKVMDFGVARQAKDTVTRLTNADAAGTPAYMAPEQHLGFCGKASDIYSLGVCLYEALTGRLPFPGPDYLMQKERMQYQPPHFLRPDLPKAIEVFFRVTLAKDPKLRVADAEELVADLESLSPTLPEA